MFKIVLSHALCDEGMQLLCSHPDTEVIVANENNKEKILPYLITADAFILRIGGIDANMMRKCSKLKVIARPGVGVDTIDVGYATKSGIPVVITPGENSRSVAEHVFALLLSISKNLFESRKEALSGNYSIRNAYKAFELYGKTLGIIGFGHVGRIVGDIAKALGMKVFIYDPFVSENSIVDKGFSYFHSLEELLPMCDVVTVHVASTDETRGMFSERLFHQMRKGSIFINCARGDLVDESALFDCLKTGVISYAAEDMMCKEPFDMNSPLLQLDNFIATPHMAALTKESAARCAVKAVEGVLAILNGQEWSGVYDADVYSSPYWRNRN